MMGGDDDDGEAPSVETQEGSSKDLFQASLSYAGGVAMMGGKKRAPWIAND
eukprot:COSAG01_NODE_3391_length_6151_cov_4.717944_6_plen_51_part_00